MYSTTDLSFLQVAIYLGFLSPSLGQQLLERKSYLAGGHNQSIAHLALEENFLSREKVDRIVFWLEEGYDYCDQCRKIFPILKPASSIPCPQCSRPMKRQEKHNPSQTTLLPLYEDLEAAAQLQKIENISLSTFSPRKKPPYMVTKFLGQGGYGTVYQVLDPFSGRLVALKMLSPLKRDNKAAQKRFKREIQITSLLEHPNIIPLYESGLLESGELYYVMKEVKGGTLRDKIQEYRELPEGVLPPLGEVLEIFLKICDAIGYAHSKGVIHRDLKPGNILIGEFGEVLVLDWGLAKCSSVDGLVEEDLACRQDLQEKITFQGNTIGTPGYMSPEQARSSTVDHRSDIFALGAILYELASLEKAFFGTNQRERLVHSMMSKPIPPHIRSPRLKIHPKLSAIILKALEKQPEERFQEVLSLKKELLLFLEEEKKRQTQKKSLKKGGLAVRLSPEKAMALGFFSALAFCAVAFWIWIKMLS